MISFQVKDINAHVQYIEIPDYINLSLMDVLKAWEHPTVACCGIAQCAACHVLVLNGFDQFLVAGVHKIDTLNLLPDSNYKSRFARQIKANQQLNGCTFEIKSSRNIC